MPLGDDTLLLILLLLLVYFYFPRKFYGTHTPGTPLPVNHNTMHKHA